MEILETIPIYTLPAWVIYLGLIGLVLTIPLCFTRNDYAILILGTIAGAMIFTALGLAIFRGETEFSHNEYVIRLTDMSAEDFAHKYEIVKYFDYSDAIQVKEIETK